MLSGILLTGWCPGSTTGGRLGTLWSGDRVPQTNPPWSRQVEKRFWHCVNEGDPECTYIPGTSSLAHGDHRSQMMMFCGHELWCNEFNSERVLQAAKENVERHYPVVGVLEHLNKTLAVAEAKFPNLLRGATELYYKSKEVMQRR